MIAGSAGKKTTKAETMITIDGAQGEGGGQILRTALTLSMATGKPFQIDRIRAGRAKPGLMRQHLAAVRAAAAVCGGRVAGDEPGSTRLRFEPGPVRAGDYIFAINSAGSTALVLQTVLLPLALASQPSSLVLRGGTHNGNAPPFEFVDRALLPLLRRIGLAVTAGLKRPGFYPAGGGQVEVAIAPADDPLRPLDILERGESRGRSAEAILANLPFAVAQRELDTLRAALDWPVGAMQPRIETQADGPGNVLAVTLVFEAVTEVVTGFGERGLAAETIARDVAGRTAAYLGSGAAVGPFLADQLLLPMALCRGGRFSTVQPTAHTTTNLAVIGAFLDDIRFEVAAAEEARWTIGVSSARWDDAPIRTMTAAP